MEGAVYLDRLVDTYRVYKGVTLQSASRTGLKGYRYR
jgi:hypothetical protein